MFASVIVDVAHTSVDRIFEYKVPQGITVEPGTRVLVPFGGNKTIEGIVIEVSETAEYQLDKIKELLKSMEDFSALTAEQIALAKFVQKRYNTTLASALRLMIPAQLRKGRVSEKKKKICRLVLKDHALDVFIKTLYSKKGEIKSPKQLEVINKLSKGNELLSDLPESAVKSLVKKGAVEIEESKVNRSPFTNNVPLIEDYALSSQQVEVLEKIKKYGVGKPFLLHGATGSGKTEIYIRIIRDCMQNGKTAIMLVPEISLTPQTYTFLKQRFSCDIAVFHSGLTAGERFDEWMKVKRGKAKIVLGARSAIFSPLENIGAIIIDEQHESSYKADSFPNYSAIEIAEQRAGVNGALLIMGSATPDIETYYAAEQGKYVLLKMPERLFGLPLPVVETIDMREELKRGNRSILSGKLYEALKNVIAKGEQSMLFLNRRGYSTFVMCRSCGHTVYCDTCDVTLTYHKAQDILKCHYCGREKKVGSICPECGKPHLKFFGTGTQQVEECVKKMLPDARVMRMDIDTMGAKDAHLKAFEDFSGGKADILIGTQMITKGFDFGKVTLSAVLAADTMLNFPDYRSAEYCFSQITQIAGRAGRKGSGRVILQTYNPEHYAVRYASKHDYENFFKHELSLRKMAKMPPFSVFIKIQFSGDKQDEVISSVKDFINRLKTVLLPRKDDIISIRASESAIKRINNMYRYHVLINLYKRGDALDEVFKIFTDTKYKGVLTGIDINPTAI